MQVICLYGLATKDTNNSKGARHMAGGLGHHISTHLHQNIKQGDF